MQRNGLSGASLLLVPPGSQPPRLAGPTSTDASWALMLISGATTILAQHCFLDLICSKLTHHLLAICPLTPAQSQGWRLPRTDGGDRQSFLSLTLQLSDTGNWYLEGRASRGSEVGR